MDIKGLEIRVKYGVTTYWKDNILVGKKCTKCDEDKDISEFAFRDKKGESYLSCCKKCNCEKAKKWNENNKEHKKKRDREWRENNKKHRMGIENLEARTNKRYKTAVYWENGIMVSRKCTTCGENKKINEFNFLNKKSGTYKAECKECERRRNKKWRENNSDYDKEYRENNLDKIKEYRKKHPNYDKQRYKINKNNNVIEITKILHQLNPILKTLSTEAYGSIYKITNIKTDRVYIGQTILPLEKRYGSNIIQGWIKERKKKKNQKFLYELEKEEDFIVDRSIAVGICEYHLNALEVYFINKYNSCENGYNNNVGNHNTTDGLEEFNKILSQYNIEFKDGEIKEKRLPKQA